MNQTPSTTAFDVTFADGSRERIDAEKVFVADTSPMCGVAGHPTHIFGWSPVRPYILVRASWRLDALRRVA